MHDERGLPDGGPLQGDRPVSRGAQEGEGGAEAVLLPEQDLLILRGDPGRAELQRQSYQVS